MTLNMHSYTFTVSSYWCLSRHIAVKGDNSFLKIPGVSRFKMFISFTFQLLSKKGMKLIVKDLLLNLIFPE